MYSNLLFTRPVYSSGSEYEAKVAESKGEFEELIAQNQSLNELNKTWTD
jgi:hypothetical protein